MAMMMIFWRGHAGRHYATSWKIADSIPDEATGFNPSSRTMALWSTQHLTEMSTRNLPGSKGRPDGAQGWQLHRHLWADCLENVGASTSHKRMDLDDLVVWCLYPFTFGKNINIFLNIVFVALLLWSWQVCDFYISGTQQFTYCCTFLYVQTTVLYIYIYIYIYTYLQLLG
jgi:hypothetical protein